ncbi:MAG: hypothetical protein H7177_07005 [Rhizobacter sp.]|nr:hypothetical protein [Bacteriovorax sp.]
MKILLLLSTISFSVWSSDLSRQVWTHGSDNYLFSLDPSSNILISHHCVNSEVSFEKSTCTAAKIIQEKKTVKLPAGSMKGGKNPGAVICTIGLKQKIKILKDLQNNENSFCVFDDGSMISAINLIALVKDK